MKSLFIAPNEGIYVIDLETRNDVHEMLGSFDIVDLGSDLMMAVNGLGIPILTPNHRATLLIASLFNVIIPIFGNALLFMNTDEDLDLKALPEWVQHAIAAPFN